MKKIKKVFIQFLDLFSSIYNSQFTLLEKLDLLRALLWCFFGARLLGKNKKVNIRTLGLKISSFGYINLLYLIREIFLLREYQLSTSNPSPLIIDCGANIGISILYFKKFFPASKILAFEPNPVIFELLKENLAQNQIEGVELYNYCLSNQDGNVEFFVNENKGTMEGSILTYRGGNNKLSVKAVRLSSFINEKVDLLKMDIEGSEVPVIEELKKEGKLSLVNTFLIEYHHNIPDHVSGIGKFIHHFESEGFTLNLRSDFGHQGSFQDVFLRISKN